MIQLALATMLFSGAPKEPTVYFNGHEIAALEVPAPIIRDNRVQVAMRPIFTALGADVQYLPETRQVVVTKGGPEVTLFLDENHAYIDGKYRYLDYPPAVVDGSLMVPLRFVTQALGANVRWDPQRRDVIIKTDVPAETDGE